jgi:hypothetical protein
MIEAVIKGPIPSIIIERFEKPPPENKLSKPKNSFPEKKLCNLEASTPGTGMVANRRNNTRAPRTKIILFRRVVSDIIKRIF